MPIDQVVAIGLQIAGRAFVLRGRLRLVGQLQHEVRLQRLLDLELQVQRRQLQQADGLLQLRRHGELLTEAKV